MAALKKSMGQSGDAAKVPAKAAAKKPAAEKAPAKRAPAKKRA